MTEMRPALPPIDPRYRTYEQGYIDGLAGRLPLALAVGHTTPEYARGNDAGWKEKSAKSKRDTWNAITGLIPAARPELV